MPIDQPDKSFGPFDILIFKLTLKKIWVLYDMDYINKSFSIAKTPVTNDNWNKKSDEERKEIIRNFLNKQKFQDFEVVSAQEMGNCLKQKKVSQQMNGV